MPCHVYFLKAAYKITKSIKIVQIEHQLLTGVYTNSKDSTVINDSECQQKTKHHRQNVNIIFYMFSGKELIWLT